GSVVMPGILNEQATHCQRPRHAWVVHPAHTPETSGAAEGNGGIAGSSPDSRPRLAALNVKGMSHTTKPVHAVAAGTPIASPVRSPEHESGKSSYGSSRRSRCWWTWTGCAPGGSASAYVRLTRADRPRPSVGGRHDPSTLRRFCDEH